MQAYSIWYIKWYRWKEHQLREGIRKGKLTIQELEDRRDQLEEQNKRLTQENKELGIFSEDGKIVRNNHKNLEEQVQDLKDSIADTEEDYTELLAENERLKKELELAEQKRAQLGKNPKYDNLLKIKKEGENQPPEGETEE